MPAFAGRWGRHMRPSPPLTAPHLLITAEIHALQFVRQAAHIGGRLRRHLRKLPHHGCTHRERAGMPGLWWLFLAAG